MLIHLVLWMAFYGLIVLSYLKQPISPLLWELYSTAMDVLHDSAWRGEP